MKIPESTTEAIAPERAEQSHSGISTHGIVLGLALVIAISFIVSYA